MCRSMFVINIHYICSTDKIQYKNKFCPQRFSKGWFFCMSSPVHTKHYKPCIQHGFWTCVKLSANVYWIIHMTRSGWNATPMCTTMHTIIIIHLDLSEFMTVRRLHYCKQTNKQRKSKGMRNNVCCCFDLKKTHSKCKQCFLFN